MSGSTLVAAFCGMNAASPVKTSLNKSEGDGKVKLSTAHVGRDGKHIAVMLKTAAADADKAFNDLTRGETFRATISVVDDGGLVTKASKSVQGLPETA